jgi:hypothetical protein
MLKKKKRSKVMFVTLSPTKIEVIGFNGLDSRIRNGEEHAGGNDHRCTEGNQSKSGADWYNLDNEVAVALA